MNNAIVSLVRGYNDKFSYQKLIKRNLYLLENITLKHKVICPYLIFHEGNITNEHQSYIKYESQNDNITFIDVSESWNTKVRGYLAMCMFNTYDIWNYCKDFDYIMRVDDDCFITECFNDPFADIQDKVFLYSILVEEFSMSINNSLPIYIEQLTGVAPEYFYNPFPYTNVYVSNVNFWLDKEVSDLLKKIINCSWQKTYSWGDLPILGSILNLYAPNKIGPLKGITYQHGSWNEIVKTFPINQVYNLPQ